MDRHGFGAWAAIGADPSFTFEATARIAGALPAATATARPAASADGEGQGGGGEDGGGVGAMPVAAWMPSAVLLTKRLTQIVKVLNRLLRNPK